MNQFSGTNTQTNQIFTCTWGGIHPWGLSRRHQRRTMVMFHGPPVPASLHLLALQLKREHRSIRFSHPPFWFKSRWCDGDARERSLIDRGVLITPPFVEPFCRSVGAQSTTEAWRADPLTPNQIVAISFILFFKIHDIVLSRVVWGSFRISSFSSYLLSYYSQIFSTLLKR